MARLARLFALAIAARDRDAKPCGHLDAGGASFVTTTIANAGDVAYRPAFVLAPDPRIVVNNAASGDYGVMYLTQCP